MSQWALKSAFRQSLVWRGYAAFSEDTFQAIDDFSDTEHDLYDTLDVLLTVATLPEHPLNALFLDRRLRDDALADCDAWWSVHLHQTWGSQGAVDRLVDWTSSVTSTTSIDDETVDLCSIVVAWMFSTSNRFLRDRATQGLVSLLTGRLEGATRLVERFSDVDDPYVAERVYAVAYGVAMRCHEPAAVGTLARSVYGHVFASGNPPPQILLRDYARGVVERATYLGSDIDVDPQLIRPPYTSKWPVIPTEEDIEPLLPDWSAGAYDCGDSAWARNRIGMSVMNDDFPRYVIGTNWWISSDWLSIRLDEAPWEPPSLEHQLQAFVPELSDTEREAFDRISSCCGGVPETAFRSFRHAGLRSTTMSSVSAHDTCRRPCRGDAECTAARAPSLRAREGTGGGYSRTPPYRRARTAIRAEELIQRTENDREMSRPPRFDLRQVQRYILRRVFDLGWTSRTFRKVRPILNWIPWSPSEKSRADWQEVPVDCLPQDHGLSFRPLSVSREIARGAQ